MKNIIRLLTAWAWRPEIEAAGKLPDVEHHRDNLLKLWDSSQEWPKQLQDENARLRNLCLQMRLSFRRQRGRSMQCIPYNWPNP